MSDTNLHIVRRLLEDVWTEGNLSLLPELIADNAVSHPMTHHDASGRIIAEWATWDTGNLLQSAAAPRVLSQLSLKA